MNILRALVGAAGLAMLMSTAALAQQPDTVRVTGDRVNLRAFPSIDSAIVRTMSKGSLVTVLQREGAWARIQAQSSTGWVRSSTLSASAPGATTGAVTAAPVNPPPASARPASTAAMAPAAMARPSEPSSEHTRLTIFGGMALNEGDPTPGLSRSNYLVGLSVLFPVGQVISIGPELTYFHNKYSQPNTIDGDLSGSSDAGSASLMVRAHSHGSVRFYVEAGPTALSAFRESQTEGTATTTTSDVHLQGGLTGGAGIQFGPIVLGAHYQHSFATGSQHVTYFSAGLTF
jgi:SH3-like domain-containing protein